jgi:hypothetical protein
MDTTHKSPGHVVADEYYRTNELTKARLAALVDGAISQHEAEQQEKLREVLQRSIRLIEPYQFSDCGDRNNEGVIEAMALLNVTLTAMIGE